MAKDSFVERFSRALMTDPQLYQGILDDGDQLFDFSKDIEAKPGSEFLLPVEDTFYLVPERRLTQGNLAPLVCRSIENPDRFFRSIQGSTTCDNKGLQPNLERLFQARNLSTIIGRLSAAEFENLLRQIEGWKGVAEDRKRYYSRKLLELFFREWSPTRAEWVERQLIRDPNVPLIPHQQDTVRGSVSRALQNPVDRAQFLNGLVLYQFDLKESVAEVQRLIREVDLVGAETARQRIGDLTLRAWYRINPHYQEGGTTDDPFDTFRETYFNHLYPYAVGVAVKHVAKIFPADPSQPPTDIFKFLGVIESGRLRSGDRFLPPSLKEGIEEIVHAGSAAKILPSPEARLYLALISTPPAHRFFLASSPQDLVSAEMELFLDAYRADPSGRGWTFRLDPTRLEAATRYLTESPSELHQTFLADAVILEGILEIDRLMTTNGGDFSAARTRMLERLALIFTEASPESQGGKLLQQVEGYNFAALFDRLEGRVQFNPEFQRNIEERGRDIRQEAGIARLEEDNRRILGRLDEVAATLHRLDERTGEWMTVAGSQPIEERDTAASAEFFQETTGRFNEAIQEFNAQCALTVDGIGFQSVSQRGERLREVVRNLPTRFNEAKRSIEELLQGVDRRLESIRAAGSLTLANEREAALREMYEKFKTESARIAEQNPDPNVRAIVDQARLYVALAKKSYLMVYSAARLKDSINGYASQVARFVEATREDPTQIRRHWRLFSARARRREKEIRETLGRMRGYIEHTRNKLLGNVGGELRSVHQALDKADGILASMSRFIETVSVERLDALVQKVDKGLSLLKPRWGENASLALMTPVDSSGPQLNNSQAMISTELDLTKSPHLDWVASGTFMAGGEPETEDPNDTQQLVGVGARLKARLQSDIERVTPLAVAGAHIMTEWAQWDEASLLVIGGAGLSIPVLASHLLELDWRLNLQALYARDVLNDSNLVLFEAGLRWR